MEIRIMAPGVDCKTTKTSIACKVAHDIIKEHFYGGLNDAMTIYDTRGNCITEFVVKDGLVNIYHAGKKEMYCLSDTENIILWIVSHYING